MCPARRLISHKVGLEDGKLLVYSPGEILMAGVTESYARATQSSVKNGFSGLLFLAGGAGTNAPRSPCTDFVLL